MAESRVVIAVDRIYTPFDPYWYPHLSVNGGVYVGAVIDYAVDNRLVVRATAGYQTTDVVSGTGSLGISQRF